MRIRQTFAVIGLAAATGGLIVPALAQSGSGAESALDQSMNKDRGRMGNGAMGAGMMSGGCGGLMQPMNGGGRPNSQWQTHPPGGGSVVN